MKILKHWFWKYQIFFNENVYNEVVKFSENLTGREKNIFLNEVKFFKSFYTFQLLLDALDSNKEKEANDIVNYAFENLDKLSKLSEGLYDYYIEIIKSHYSSYQDKLIKILDYSLKSSSIVIDIHKYLKIIIDKNFDIFLDFLNREIKKHLNKPTLKDKQKNDKSSSSTLAEFDKIYNKLSSDKDIIKMFGKNDVDKFDILIKDISHYGEFWDADFYDKYKENTLILKQNLNNMNKNDFIYTVIHEVYPGHAHFFKTIKSNEIICDTGALFLFEGYATAVELLVNFRPSYIEKLKLKYLKIINYSLFEDLNLLSNKQMLNDLKLLNQYIGYSEAYYIGAFYILFLLENQKLKNIKEFLEKVKNNNIGNFSFTYLNN